MIKRLKKVPLLEKDLLTSSGISSLNWIHWVVLTASLFLTVSAWYITSKQSKDKVRAQFEIEKFRLIDTVESRLEKYENALRSGVAAIQMLEGKIDYNFWKTFAKNLAIEKKYPGINGIGVIFYLERKQLNSFINFQSIFR